MADPVAVLLRDPRWPDVPGVCCWRESVRAAFSAEPAGRAPRGAALVLAESLDAAEAARAAVNPARRIWTLALPPEYLVGALPGYGERLARLAPVIGGFLVATEEDRESVERAASDCRPRIELFPPVSADRPCRQCAGRPRVRSGVPAEVDRLAGFRDDVQAGWTVAVQRRAATAVLPRPDGRVASRPPRTAVVSGYDLKFARELAARLDGRADLSVTLDEWPALGRRSARTRALARRADSIVAEWARPSAAWLSRSARPGQLVVVRLHRYELETRYPHDIDIDRVDAVVHVSPPIGRRIRAELGWPAEKLVHIPNLVDVDWLDRPKLPDARFGIGMVGIELANKRFDLALDLLAEVRRRDPRFALFVRSTMPWHNPYAWARPAERAYVGRWLDRIDRDPLLRGAVILDPPGRDMARWYRRIGVILSLSDVESFHLGLAEGMASGAVPVIRPWPGADEVYGTEWITADAVPAVLACADPGHWADRAGRARAEIRRAFDPEPVVAAWADLLHGDVAGARRYFAD